MKRLTDKVALVTGGASGIGRASCEKLASEGAQVLVTDVNVAGGHLTVETVGTAARFQQLDVSQEADWIAAIQQAINYFGRLDILVNCAGIGFSGHAEEIDLEAWNQIVAVNLTGTMLGCKHGIKAIKKSDGGGSIINISSVGGLLGTSDLAAYCATKGGVTLLTKAVALDCAELGYGIRCNSIHPTYVDTEMLDPVAAMIGSREQMVATMLRNVPLGRLATAQDIANSVSFLASDESAMITGTAFLVDGGTTAGMPASHSA
ncbi:MAG: glucose 1-dehydrogenase [Pseudomonadales bacterium]|nr:glucose 1-dehydrogenase [Pseudomonadales bacterium]MCP5215015.1 glucose 1-dehydrogenase [Pseudomonadales bacterium]